MEIIWKPIPGFNRYEASNTGFLRSLDYKGEGYIRILKPSARDGYYQTMLLRDDGKYCTKKVHYLVTLTFFGVRPKGLQVNHKDGNKLNNAIDNLEYCTQSENCQHSFDTGLQQPKRGRLNGMAKLTDEQVLELRAIKSNSVSRYWGRNELAGKYGISIKHLQQLVNDPDSWPHLSS